MRSQGEALFPDFWLLVEGADSRVGGAWGRERCAHFVPVASR